MTRSSRWLALIAAAPLLLLPRLLAAQESDADWVERCLDDRHGARIMHCEVRDVAVQTTGSLDLESQNGVVDIRGADGTTVRLRARVRAWADTREEAVARARAVRVVVDGGTVRADGPSSSRGEGWNVDFVGSVPRRYDLELSTENGPLSVRDVSGRIDVESQNGPLDLARVGGTLRARAANGPVTLELADERVAEQGVDVRTSNGPLTILVPRSIDGRLQAGTENGPISTDLDVEIRRHSRHSVSGEIDAQLGSGGGTIRAHTSNGPLTVRSSR